jgi:type 1 glutamine amidotransferase
MASGGMAGSGGAIATGGMGGADPGPQLPKRVLLYHKSPITNVTAQMDLLASKLTEWGFESDRTMDPAMITTDTLKKYGAVGMINPCFDAFGPDGAPQAAALKAFVEAGGGLWGNHCAAVTYNKATPPHPYNQLLGGRGGDGFFDGASTCQKLGDHPTITGLPATFPYSGNIDNTDYLADDITILVRCTWSGGGMKDVAVSWTREPGEGRIFFSNFAKFDVDLADPVLGPEHLYKGLAWVLRR